MNEKFCILIRISLEFVPKGPIDNYSALIQVMAWRWTGDKPLPEAMLLNSLTDICGTRGIWVNCVEWSHPYLPKRRISITCAVCNLSDQKCYLTVSKQLRNLYNLDFLKFCDDVVAHPHNKGVHFIIIISVLILRNISLIPSICHMDMMDGILDVISRHFC